MRGSARHALRMGIGVGWIDLASLSLHAYPRAKTQHKMETTNNAPLKYEQRHKLNTSRKPSGEANSRQVGAHKGAGGATQSNDARWHQDAEPCRHQGTTHVTQGQHAAECRIC